MQMICVCWVLTHHYGINHIDLVGDIVLLQSAISTDEIISPSVEADYVIDSERCSFVCVGRWLMNDKQ